MKTADFFNIFKHHQLGKKRNFGAYRVIDGDNCQVLVRASTRHSVPNGSELIAISFSPHITLWHDANLRQVKHRVVTEIQGVMIRINSIILDENADNLLDSGIIDIDGTNDKILIEIGDTPWLLEHEATMDNDNWAWTYNIGTKLGVRCASVSDALLEAKMKPGCINALGWTMERMPDDFTPDGISPEDRIILSKPISPMDYGFQIEHCTRETTYNRGSVGGDLLFLKEEFAGCLNGLSYTAAYEVWDEALQRFSEMTPSQHENISCYGGEMVRVGGALYLKGKHRQLYHSNKSATLDGWYKLLDKSSKIRLKA